MKDIKTLLPFLFLLSILSCPPQKDTSMPNKDRVTAAFEKHNSTIEKQLITNKVNPNSFQLHLRAYKAEALLEAWVKNIDQDQWTLLKTYPFCTNSGGPGPKRKEGDLQIPEGFYHIDRFNPKSKFHLSLGINYPNTSDLKLGDPNRPGSDIFIHGGCKSIGCIAITNDLIEQIYILASEAKRRGQKKIPVHIFPCRMEETKLNKLSQITPKNRSFWQELKVEDDYFRSQKEIKYFHTMENGRYQFE